MTDNTWHLGVLPPLSSPRALQYPRVCIARSETVSKVDPRIVFHPSRCWICWRLKLWDHFPTFWYLRVYIKQLLQVDSNKQCKHIFNTRYYFQLPNRARALENRRKCQKSNEPIRRSCMVGLILFFKNRILAFTVVFHVQRHFSLISHYTFDPINWYEGGNISRRGGGSFVFFYTNHSKILYILPINHCEQFMR